MQTSQKPISSNGGEKLTSLQADSRANHSVMPDEEKEKTMNVIYGRKCAGLLKKSGPLGLLAKMLLESQQWSKTGMSFKWVANPICSAKITTFTNGGNNSQLTESVVTLNERVMKSNRLLFRLVPLVHRIDATGFLLLPTPMAVDIYHKKRTAELKSTGVKHFHSRINGEKRPNGLTDYLHFVGLLPTPTAQDFKPREPNSKQQGIGEFVRYKICDRGKDGEREKMANTFHLSPLFTEENDGFPFNVDDFTISFKEWRDESLKAYGNAIVPQVMYRIFEAIEFAEKEK